MDQFDTLGTMAEEVPLLSGHGHVPAMQLASSLHVSTSTQVL
jgi:hypothetical protein